MNKHRWPLIPLSQLLKNPLVFCFSRSSGWVLYPIAVDVNKKNFLNSFILFGVGFALTPSTINSWFIGVASALLLDVTGILKFCWLAANKRTGIKFLCRSQDLISLPFFTFSWVFLDDVSYLLLQGLILLVRSSLCARILFSSIWFHLSSNCQIPQRFWLALISDFQCWRCYSINCTFLGDFFQQ